MPYTRSSTKKSSELADEIDDDFTDSETKIYNEEEEILKRVPETMTFDVDDALCSGSCSSHKSRHNLSSEKSKHNSCIDGKRLRLLKAQLRERQLKEELEIDNKLLENRRRLVEARNLVEMARLESEADNQENDDESSTSTVIKTIDPSSVILFPPTEQLGFKRESRSNDLHDGVSPTRKPASNLSSFNIQLPKLELMTFDGNPATFWKFMRQFDLYLGDKLSDDSQRFLYLLHYCRGPAKVAIEECIMLPPDVAYIKARAILNELFGKSRVIMKSVIESLFNVTTPIPTTPDALSSLAVKMQNCEITLSQMNRDAELSSENIMDRIVRMLSFDLQCKWAELVDANDQNGKDTLYKDLMNFISTRSRIAGKQQCSVNYRPIRSHTEGYDRKLDKPVAYKKTTFMSYQPHKADNSRTINCPHCDGSHYLDCCEAFKSMEVPKRWERVRELGACFICFRTNHQARNCYTGRRCRKEGCNARHHDLLHSVDSEKRVSVPVSNVNATNTSNSKILLGVVPVILEGPSGRIETYALLDNGSNTSLICKGVMEQLGMEHNATKLNLTTVNSSTTIKCSEGQLKVLSLDGHEEILIDKVYSIDKLPVETPDPISQRTAKNWSYLKGCEFKELYGAQVSLLIGCDVPEAHWVLEQKIGGRKQPFAVRTLLGWVLYGPVGDGNSIGHINCLSGEEVSIQDQLRNLYNAEFADIDSLRHDLSREEKVAVELVDRATVWKDGHFEVPLPWNGNEQRLLNNYSYAERRLEHIKRRFVKDGSMFNKYSEVIAGYRKKGYIVKTPLDQLTTADQLKWYLPHHPVLNPKKPEKLRVVFDFAAKCHGISLNDCLHQGPDVTADLVGVLLRFRLDYVAVVADIEEMFLQVRVPEKDRGALRFLWWSEDDFDEDIIEYQLTVHPFGATSSPFCANFALHKAVEQFGDSCDDLLKNVVRCNFYVDDCLASLPSIAEANKFIEKLCRVLEKGGFRLRKWISNERQVLDLIPNEERAKTVVNIDSNPLPIERTLGLEWDAQKDVLRFQFCLPDKPMTRRGILSCISTIFDPLGVVGPIILPVKCLLQDLCREKLEWDEVIEGKKRELWENWVQFVRAELEICVPRCVKIKDYDNSKLPQLHIFCDACESGYGAVSYVRYVAKTGHAQCKILFAKTRVAPLKTITIPRLELTSAVLAIRVYQIIAKEVPVKFENVNFWTDSMIVLHYINNTTSRFSTFVANRLSVIHEYTVPSQWRHVKSEQNPADYASRGFNSRQCDWNVWLDGPNFLTKDEYLWPENQTPAVSELNLEFKTKINNVFNVTDNQTLDKLLSHFSDWYKLLKSVAWLIRFKRYLLVMKGNSTKTSIDIGSLKVAEIEEARRDILYLVQSNVFLAELAILKKEKHDKRFDKDSLMKNSPLRKLCPILVDGIICVGGRLQRSGYTSTFKHPVILPKSHCVTSAIIRHYHKIEGHVGVSHVLAMIRQSYWILQGGSAVKTVLEKCLPCRKRRGKLGEQMMASLPPVRVQRGWFAFMHVGVDFFGPILVKKNRHSEKRYGCVFSCLQSRAVHIEVTHSLSTDSFIMALMRFVNRRGKPEDIFSDNGSNFVGADSELKNCLHEFSQSAINDKMLFHGIQWHFQPPLSSHRGGVWERMIRSIKKIFNLMISDQVLNDETLVTFLIEVERILNDRPLIPLYTDIDEPDVLRPSQLILMRECQAAVPDLSENMIHRRWKQINYLATAFWNRWVKEYLPLLQLRQKWMIPAPNFRPGEVVLIASENTKRMHWPMGVILECQKDEDGLVRTVLVRTTSGVLKRDVRKLCLLEGVGQPEQ